MSMINCMSTRGCFHDCGGLANARTAPADTAYCILVKLSLHKTAMIPYFQVPKKKMLSRSLNISMARSRCHFGNNMAASN